MGAGDLYINGVAIVDTAVASNAASYLGGSSGTVSDRVGQLIAAINLKTSNTGVTAAAGTVANTYTLTADFGRAIVVTSDKTTTQAAISGFAVEDAKAGVGGKVVDESQADWRARC
jgi:hypothetical protein